MQSLLYTILIFFFFISNSTSTETYASFPGDNNTKVPPLDPSVPTGSGSDCFIHTNCETCSKTWSCVWCYDERNNTTPLPDRCIEGSLLGPKSQCANWQYRQCMWNGYWTMIAVFVILGVVAFLIVFIIICARCCCKKPKRYTNIQEMEPFLQPSRDFYDGDGYQDAAEFRASERSLAKKRTQLYQEYEDSSKLDTNPFS